MRKEQKRSLSSLSLSKGSKGLISGILSLTAFIFCLLFVGCDNGLDFKDSQVPKGYGQVSVNVLLGGKNSALSSNARSIFPKPEANTFTRYIYTFTKDSVPTSFEKSASDHEPFTLPLGTYTVEVKAYDADSTDDNDPAATGVSESFNVATVNAGTISVKLTPVTNSGKGTLDININIPEDATLGFNLVDIDGNNPFEGLQTPDGVNVTSHSIIGTVEMDAGSYLLTVTATRGDDKAGKVEVVHIYRSLKTECNIAISEDDLNVPAYRITLSPNNDKNFGSEEYRYSAIDPYVVTIHNRGLNATGALTIVLDNNAGYNLSKTSITDIEPSASETFTITPKSNLSVNSYTAKVTVSGDNDLSASFDVSFIVAPRAIEFSIDDIALQDHTGSAISPIPVVKDDLHNTLIKDSDYTVTYDNNKDAGINTAEVIVTGINNYAGSTGTKHFTIASYGITLNHTSTVTLTGDTNYEPSDKVVTVVVTNIGNQPTGDLTITLTGANNNSFAISPSQTISSIIDHEGTYEFTVKPVVSLSAATYNATVTVTGAKNIEATFPIEFIVTTVPVYAINVTGTGTFSAEDYGYTPVTPVTVEVANAGNRETGTLTIALSGTYKDSFTLSPPSSLSSVVVDDKTTFTVAPNTGLEAGTYTATVTVSGGNSIVAKTLDLSFTVNRKSIENFFVIANIPAETYNRAAHEPVISITSATYILGTDYTVAYSNNTDASSTALVTITGKGNYTGTILEYFTINQKPITGFTVDPDFEIEYEVDDEGSFDPQSLSFAVKDDTYTLATGEYNVSFSSSEKDDEEGFDVYEADAIVTVIITGAGNYTGVISKTFTIVSQE